MQARCLYCEEPFTGRVDKLYCSAMCAWRYKQERPKERPCRLCGTVFSIMDRHSANRRYCSQACAKRANTKRTLLWHEAHPDAMARYNKSRVAKEPGIWRAKHRQERVEAIRLLGGCCLVCGVENPNWLHIDYIPTTNGKPYRHPRHLKYIRDHATDFRLLCANHHYELTLTGTIAGTRITQGVQS